MELTRILRKVEMFRDVSDQDLEQIAEFCTLKTYAKGELLFEEGATGEEFYIVTKGYIAVNKNVAGGRKRNLSNLGEGDVFGEIALFDAQPRSADAEVIEDAEIIVIPNHSFLTLLKQNHELAGQIQTQIIRVLCKRLRNANDMLKEGVIWGFSMEL